jgi:hypothetical protein
MDMLSLYKMEGNFVPIAWVYISDEDKE